MSEMRFEQIQKAFRQVFGRFDVLQVVVIGQGCDPIRGRILLFSLPPPLEERFRLEGHLQAGFFQAHFVAIEGKGVGHYVECVVGFRFHFSLPFFFSSSFLSFCGPLECWGWPFGVTQPPPSLLD